MFEQSADSFFENFD